MEQEIERFRRFFACCVNEPDRSGAILLPAKFGALHLIHRLPQFFGKRHDSASISQADRVAAVLSAMTARVQRQNYGRLRIDRGISVFPMRRIDMKSTAVSIAFCLAAIACTAAAEAEAIEVFIRLIDQVDTPAREPGVLIELKAKEGQMVCVDEVLGRVEDVEAQFNSRRAELELTIASEEAANDLPVQAADKAAEVADNDWKRAQRARAAVHNAISDSELEHRKLTAEKAVLDLEAARRKLKVASMQRDLKQNELAYSQRKLEQHQVTSPLDGMVVELYRRQGEWVEPGEKVLRIIRLDRLRAEGFVDASVAGPDWLGQQAVVTVTDAKEGEQSYAGKIVFVSPEIDPVNGQVAVWAEVENRELSLRPGLRAKMTIAE
jgi:macrolide-specific efflux system membrane fusion protein